MASSRTTPVVALALLEALRSSDTPEELLEDEDVQQSLPRRLGLSEVVNRQIRRYEDLRDRKTGMSARELADLFVLVSRRPDAEAVFDRAGRWLARRRHRDGRLGRGVARIPLPGLVQRRFALRNARAVAGQVNPGSSVRSEQGPPALVVEGSLPPAAGVPAACRVTGSALITSLSIHGLDGHGPPALHPLCEGRGDACCLWRPAGEDGIGGNGAPAA